ncbi:hypothetical protein [Prosthecobacter sp.]|uniref:hypothetical protein n=1 Tax=Prosthecobacter sp. TaxID=1965333 RepID=UPI003782F2E4
MLTRLTALILTLCIGLPMCWCCIAAPQQEKVASCCAKKHHAASEHAPSHSREPSCPCAKHEDSRDVASTFVKTPAPSLQLLTDLVWVAPSAAASAPSISTCTTASRHDHGPPLHAPPLYARHCALLI